LFTRSKQTLKLAAELSMRFGSPFSPGHLQAKTLSAAVKTSLNLDKKRGKTLSAHSKQETETKNNFAAN